METDRSATDENRRQVTIELTADEALVFFELLARWGDTGDLTVPLRHQAEQRVLRDILAMLESTLVEPLLPNYNELVSEARKRIQDVSE
jgi:hypothetical protein